MKWILLLTSLNCFAGNSWIPLEEFGKSNPWAYRGRFSCESISKKECVEIEQRYDKRFAKLVDRIVDDFNKPIVDTINFTQFSSQEEYDNAWHSASCEAGYEMLYDTEDWSYWCEKLIGYETKVDGKKVVHDETLKAQALAEDAQAKAEKDAAESEALNQRKDIKKMFKWLKEVPDSSPTIEEFGKIKKILLRISKDLYE